MRHSLKYAALFTALLAAACSDVPTGTPLTRTGSPMARSLSGDIDQMVADFFPQGLETATGARWATVQQKLAAGDVEGARKHLVDLAKFIRLKTNNISAPANETQQHAATRLVLAMSTYVYGGPTAAPPEPGADVAFEVVPAGAAATVTTPSQHAAVDLEAGSTNEDRIIVVSQELTSFPDQCSGPLPTSRCQYPLFYKFESFPKLKLNKVGRFATCMVTSGDRRPLEYPSGPNSGQVDDRMRLAHNKPESEADYTPGGSIIEGIEVLPKAATQKGLVTCEGVTYALAPPTVRGGWLGRGERALYAVANFAGRLLTPKNLYAWDSGPEHESAFFSNFNGVDPESAPDLAIASLANPSSAMVGTEVTVSYVVENRSRRSGGEATAASSPTTVSAWLSSDQTIGEGDISLGSAAVPALPPDESFPVSHTFTAPETAGAYYVIVKVDANTTLTEVTLENNEISSPISVNADFVGGFWNGTLRAPGATAGGQPVTLYIVSQDGNSCTGQFRAALVGSTVAYNTTYIFTTCQITGATLTAAIDPWSAPTSSAVATEFSFTKVGDSVTGTASRFFLVQGIRTRETGLFTATLTLGEEALVSPPPPPPLIGLRSSLQGAASTSPVLF